MKYYANKFEIKKIFYYGLAYSYFGNAVSGKFKSQSYRKNLKA